ISNLELVLEEMQREAWLKGLKEGEEKGKLEGRLEGRLEGKLEGERKAKLQVAKNLLLLNVDIDTIAKATGLSLEEIESLKKQLM
ncbi:MAG: transposase, partial [Thermanaeromonas sp.]|nr:transposase [Thermanaeromonas sp.]